MLRAELDNERTSTPDFAAAMTVLLLHFLLGAAGALAVFLIAARAARVERFSFPSAALLIGLCCSVLAHFVSPWATPVVIGLYALTSAHELQLDRRETRRPRPAEIAVLVVLAIAIAAVVWLSAEGPRSMTSTETEAERIAIQRDLAALEAATLRYARREGRLPESLEQLVPTDLPALPRDPYGRGYVLRRGGADKVHLWSRGADGVLARYPPDIAAVVTMDDARAPSSTGP